MLAHSDPAMPDSVSTQTGPVPHRFTHGSLLGPVSGGPDSGELGAEDVCLLASAGGTRVERIVSTGQTSPAGFWYDQDEDEFVLLVAGGAVLSIAGQDAPLPLHPGDWVNIPAHCRHRVEWTSAAPPTIWLAVFSPAVTPAGA